MVSPFKFQTCLKFWKAAHRHKVSGSNLQDIPGRQWWELSRSVQNKYLYLYLCLTEFVFGWRRAAGKLQEKHRTEAVSCALAVALGLSVVQCADAGLLNMTDSLLVNLILSVLFTVTSLSTAFCVMNEDNLHSCLTGSYFTALNSLSSQAEIWFILFPWAVLTGVYCCWGK